MGRLMFLLLMVMQNFGVADAANVQKRGRKMEEIRWEKEMVRNTWAEQSIVKICRNKEQGEQERNADTVAMVRCTSQSLREKIMRNCVSLRCQEHSQDTVVDNYLEEARLKEERKWTKWQMKCDGWRRRWRTQSWRETRGIWRRGCSGDYSAGGSKLVLLASGRRVGGEMPWIGTRMMRWWGNWKKWARRKKRSRGGKVKAGTFLAESVQSTLELVVARGQVKGDGASVVKKKKKVKRWSTKMLEGGTSRREFGDTEEMVQWGSLRQDEADNFWKELCERWREKSSRSLKSRRPRRVHAVVDRKLHYTIWFLVTKWQITLHVGVFQKIINFWITCFGLCRFFFCTTRFGFFRANTSPWHKETVPTQTTTGPARSVMYRSKVHMSEFSVRWILRVPPSKESFLPTIFEAVSTNYIKVTVAGLFFERSIRIRLQF